MNPCPVHPEAEYAPIGNWSKDVCWGCWFAREEITEVDDEVLEPEPQHGSCVPRTKKGAKMRSVVCPQCGAGIGERCSSEMGVRNAHYHLARKQAVALIRNKR